MAVTTPMTISTTAAIHRKPPQEVKSTCVGEKVIHRIKMELRFREALKHDLHPLMQQKRCICC